MKKTLVRSTPDLSRSLAIAICLLSIVVCLAYAYFREFMSGWWSGHGGGIPYVFFWISIWVVVFPYRRCILPISLFAVSFTCLLEVLQLWKPDWLTRIRSTPFGAALLGSGFDWHDFLPYFIGGVIGFLVFTRVAWLNQSCRGQNGEV